MLLPAIAVIAGLAALVWSADRFVAGAAAAARHLGVPTLLIGMVVVGFGTSAPEMVISAIAAADGNPGLALGNAYGSNITNIALILGLTAVLSPIAVHSQVLRREMPLLLAVTALAIWQLRDGLLDRPDALALLAVFAAIMGWSIYQGLRGTGDPLGAAEDPDIPTMPLLRALVWLAIGVIALAASSRMLVWGAVEIARGFGVSDLIIGLTIVAIGTSLPELAASLAAVRKRQHDLALGNIVGSNMFNTLAVVGIAGAIQPTVPESALWTRDLPVMAVLTVALVVFSIGRRGAGRINRVEGTLLLAAYGAYMGWLLLTLGGAAAAS